jgi:preprotein translocase subunit YajC
VHVNLVDLLPIALVFGVMYFLIIRPQVNEKREHEKLVASLARGDRVVTASGVHGVIANVAADTILLEVSEKTRIVVDKSTVARRVVPTEPDDKTDKTDKAEKTEKTG